eukprot:1838765-Karenia_brevis.AAC.1
MGCVRRPGRAAQLDDEDARLALLNTLYRRWGIAAARVNADLLLDRLRHVGRGAAVAAERRE